VERSAQRLPVQVGGGVRSVERARRTLEAGARRVILGSALFTADGEKARVRTEFAAELLEAIGRDRIVAGIDARQGKIAIHGWRAQVPLTPEEAIAQLEPYAGAYLYTHIDGEGLLKGFPIAVAKRLRQRTSRQLIVAGGIRSQAEIDELASCGIDAVAGMAVYTNLLQA
jgi:phosphoribosylformimino-5-aminoimidazole carboxamide ribotide isomerase